MRVHTSGKSAQTHLRVLERFGSSETFSWVEAQPLTGRTHQIRVHLAHLGHPVVGDKLYCNEGEAFLKKWRGELRAKDIEQLGLPRHALHASELSLTHPQNHKKLRLNSDVPPELLAFASQKGSQSGPKELAGGGS
jgi:23S rRNA pseudouridine1911/1915/1917 synthase